MNLSNYLKGIQKELKLTTFPKQDVVINFTLFVIIFTGVMAVYLGALDLGFGEVIINSLNSLQTTTPTDLAPVVSTTTEATTTILNATTTTN